MKKGFIFLMLIGIMGYRQALAQQNDVVQTYTYQSLSPYTQKLFDTFLESELPQGTNLATVLTDNTSLRTKTRTAQALLFRNAAGDKENAASILEWILRNQYQDESSNLYGIWKTSVLNDRFDQNWREFIGSDLIIIRQQFRHLLPAKILKDIDTGLVHAAKGALKRNVGADYTNISIMSAFLMEYVGTTFGIEPLKKAGLNKAHAIEKLYHRNKTFSEFNSPTYYGVTLIGLAMWRKFSLSKEMRLMGEVLEREFWQEIAIFYNPYLKNIPGPHFRGYGMDMTRYFAITGIWIALALDDEALAPLPIGTGPKYGEMGNLAPILNLGLSIPKEVLKSLKATPKNRFITRDVPNNYKGDSIKRVSAAIYTNWMMGGLWGNKRVWDQIKVGAIHWKTENGDIGWLAILGDGHTNVKTTQNTMFVYSNAPDAYQLEVLVYAPNLEKEVLIKPSWHLPGMQLHTKSVLKVTQIEKIGSNDFEKKYAIADNIPYFYKLIYEVPASWDISRPLLEITPKK